MTLIQNITADPLQTQTIQLPNGNSFVITLYFMPQQYSWIIQQLTYVAANFSFALQGVRLTNNPNLLYQFQNIIPFGLGCFSANGREPTQQQDFSSGASQLYLLSQAEVAQWTSLLQGGTISAYAGVPAGGII
jgi:hypothetical protein